MPIDVLTNTDLTRILGPVTISKNPNTGTDGNLTVNGATGITTTGITTTAGTTIGAGGLTITAGGETITAGGLTITAGGETITAGGLTINGGNLALLGGLLQLLATGSVATPTGAAQTIATATLVSRTAPSGACTNAVLAAGTLNGQLVLVTNETTTVANTITFNTTLATGLVLVDATPTAVVIKAASCKLFIWLSSLNSGNGAWVPIPPAAG